MKGIVLAGGAGSRLYPLTKVASKQLQPVYDKPMIYYPITTMIECGIRDICLISTPQDLPNFWKLLNDGSQFGIKIDYREQARPEGIAQAFRIAESFIGSEPVSLILGDSIFAGTHVFCQAFAEFQSGATIFGQVANDPQRYSVVEFDAKGKAISIEEKPKSPRSNYAVPGLFIYDNEIIQIARDLKPSPRGELEITDVNIAYMNSGRLKVVHLPQDVTWFDAGTSSSLHEASVFVQSTEKRQGTKIGCPEEASLRQGFIEIGHLQKIVAEMPNCEYRDYLNGVIEEHHRLAN